MKPEALSVTFAAFDIASLGALPFSGLRDLFEPIARGEFVEKAESGSILDRRRRADAVARRAAASGSAHEAAPTSGARRTCPGRSVLLPGEAQRVKLATEWQRAQRGDTLYVLDEPATGLHPADADRLMRHLQGLVDAGNIVVVVDHTVRLIAQTDWVIGMGPGAGEDGSRIVASGTPAAVAASTQSRTASYLQAPMNGEARASG